MRSSVEVAMRPESFNLSRPKSPESGLYCLRLFYSPLRPLPGWFPILKMRCSHSSLRHMCVQRRAISMLGRLKDYLYVPRSSLFGDCLLITKHRCWLLHLRRCMKRWRQTWKDQLTMSYCSFIPQTKCKEPVESQHRSIS